jgi:hypothetical protein
MGSNVGCIASDRLCEETVENGFRCARLLITPLKRGGNESASGKIHKVRLQQKAEITEGQGPFFSALRQRAQPSTFNL